MSVMYKDVITMREVCNGGNTINLYYSRGLKAYMAYGMSAYCAYEFLSSLPISYSDDMQMPVVRLTELQVDYLTQRLTSVKCQRDFYCKLVMDRAMSDADYDKWASTVRDGGRHSWADLLAVY